MKPAVETANGPGSVPPLPGRTTLTWGLLAVAALLPIALLGLYAFRITSRSVEDLVRANNDSAATLTAELLGRQFEQNAGVAQVSASFPGLRDAVERRDEEAVCARLQRMVEAYPRMDRAFVTDTNGVLWSAFPPTPELIGKDFSYRDWFRGVSKEWKPYVSEAYQRLATPKALVVAVAVPVRDAQQQVTGILVSQYRLDALSQWLKQCTLGSSGYVFVLDHTGTVAAHPKLDMQARPYEDFVTVEPVRQALQGNHVTIEYVDPMAQRTMVAAFAPVNVGDHRWVVVAQQPVEEAYAPIRQSAIQIAIAAGILALAALGVVVGLHRTNARMARLNKVLEESNEQLQRLASIVASSDDAIISLTLDGIILSWNSGAERIYGYAAAEAIGRQIATPDEPTEVPKILEKIKRGEHAGQFETVHLHKDGTKLNVSLTVSPIRDSKGVVTSAAIIARDVTEARRISEALRSNEERTRRIIETAHDAFVCMDSAGSIVDWNPRAETIFGWRREEAIGKSLAEVIVPPKYREGHVRGLKRFLETGEGPVLNKTIEIAALHRDGHEFPAHPTITPVRWEDAFLFNAFVHDITERKQAEQALRDSEKRFRDLFESSPDAIFVEDLQGNVLDANPAACRLQGMGREKLVGKNVTELVPPELRLDVEQRFRTLTEDARTHLESLTLRGDGQTIPVEITTSRIEYLGKPAVLLHVRDITERKRAERELEKATNELKRSNTELEQLAYVASHDLQEPLRMVASYTQLLAKRYKGKLDTDADEFIAFAVDGAVRMQSLINDLLSYSRVGTKGKPFEPTDCSVVLGRALNNLKIAIEESGAQITNDPLPTVEGDAGQLMQVFQNLIGNAVKFRNEKAPRVHVSAQRKEHEWVFSVQDNGIGIAPEDGQRIFLIFQRLHGRGEYPGTGIGLAVCKRIVERHGGRIWVESKPGNGSTFYFTLPDKGEPVS